jgi:hypothetical protein
MLTEIFYVMLVTTVSGLVIKLSSMAFKSKCSDVSCCGLTIKRDVALEEKEHEFEILHKIPSTQINNIV